MPQNRYLVVPKPDDSGGYLADVPTLPGCVTHGETMDGALANAREAIVLHLRGEDSDSLARAGVRGNLVFATVAVPSPA